MLESVFVCRCRSASLAAVAAAALMVAEAGAAVSNVVAIDNLAASSPRYLTTNVVTFPINWDAGFVPPGAEKALVAVKGNHYNFSAEVTKPTDSVSFTLFDPATEQPYNDTLKATLSFMLNGTTQSTVTATYALRKGSFARDRVLTVATDHYLWRICRLPLDLPFDENWFLSTPTYFGTSNLVTGTSYKPVAPLDGPSTACGVLPLTRAKCGSPSRLNMKIWAGNWRMADIDLDARPGMALLVR